MSYGGKLDNKQRRKRGRADERVAEELKQGNLFLFLADIFSTISHRPRAKKHPLYLNNLNTLNNRIINNLNNINTLNKIKILTSIKKKIKNTLTLLTTLTTLTIFYLTKSITLCIIHNT